MDYYAKFIKPEEIRRDINFFFDKIKELICNDIFGQFIYDKRKKNYKTYKIENYLSGFDKTKLQFNNDIINIEFILEPSEFDEKNLISVVEPKFKSYKLNDLVLNMKIPLKKLEFKNKIIYDDNIFFNSIRKTISEIHKLYYKELNDREKLRSKYIHIRLKDVKKSHHSNWNNLIEYLIDITNQDFNNDLNKLEKIIFGIKSKNVVHIVELIHNMIFYKKHSHYRKIKINRFLSKLEKDCIDQDEIISLSNNISLCFNHKLINYKESIDFITNIIDHYNYIYSARERNIDNYLFKIWEKKNLIVLPHGV